MCGSMYVTYIEGVTSPNTKNIEMTPRRTWCMWECEGMWDLVAPAFALGGWQLTVSDWHALNLRVEWTQTDLPSNGHSRAGQRLAWSLPEVKNPEAGFRFRLF